MPFGKGLGKVLKEIDKSKALKKQRGLTNPAKRQVASIAKQVVLRNEEMKWYEFGLADTAVYSGAAPGYSQQNLTLIPQTAGASTDSTRIGDKVKLKSITVKLRLKGTVSAVTPFGQCIRIMIFQFIAPSTTAAPLTPTLNNILLADVPTGVRSAMSHRDVDHMKTYVMLYDKTFFVPNQCTAVGTAGNWVKMIKIQVPLKYAQKTINFSAGGTESNNSIWLGAIGSEPTFGAGNATYGHSHRVRFTDS